MKVQIKSILFLSYVESNEQPELTSKTETDSQIENRWQLVGGEGMVGGRGIEQKGKRTHGYGQQWGDCSGERGLRGLNGNGKI